MNVVITVKAAVYTVVFTIIGNVERGEEIDRIAKVAAGFQSCPLCHFLQERLGSRRKQSFEILRGTSLMGQGSADVLSGVGSIIISIYLV